MMSIRWFIASGLMALLVSGCNTTKSGEDIAKQVESSVVLITYSDKSGHGTGFFVEGSKGVCTILTARHVVSASHNLQVQTNDNKSLWKDINVSRFPNHDLAIITFNPNTEKCPYQPLSLGNSDTVKRGDIIYILGYPERVGVGELISQFPEGKVTAIKPQSDGYGISYQVTTAGGMSGGPVINTAGQVIAVHGRSDTELTKLSELKDGKLPQNQQIEQSSNSAEVGMQIGTFKWGVPINVYLKNVSGNNVTLSTDKSSSSNADELLERGKDLYASRNYEEALLAYEKVINIKPDYAEAWFLRGIALGELKRYTEEINSYDKAIKLNPSYAEVWNNRGSALSDVKKYEDALYSYNKAIEINQNNSLFWNNKAYVLSKLKRYQEAITSYEKAIEIKPDYEEAINGWGAIVDIPQQVFAKSMGQVLDIKPGDWSFGSLQSLVERYGIVKLYGDNMFRANRSIRRSEFIDFIGNSIEMFNKLANNNLSSCHSKDSSLMKPKHQLSIPSDIEANDWYYENYKKVVESTGNNFAYPDGFFRGNRALTRAEMIVGLNKMLNYFEALLTYKTTGKSSNFSFNYRKQIPFKEPKINLVSWNLSTHINLFAQVTSVSQFSDVNPKDWFFDDLRSMIERYGVTTGYPDGYFRANRAATRGEVVAQLNASLRQAEKLLSDSATKCNK